MLLRRNARDHLLRVRSSTLALIGRAKDHGGKGFRLPSRFVPSQVQRPMSTVDCLTLLVPPFGQFKNGGQISIDRGPVMAGLDRFPLILQLEESGPHRPG